MPSKRWSDGGRVAMLMGRRITGLDIAPGRLIAVELVAGEVARARVAEAARDDVSGTQFEGWLRALEVRGELQVVAWDAGHIHRTLLLPPMPPSDRASFVERDLARQDGTKAFGTAVVRTAKSGATTKDEVLVAAASRESVDRLLAPFLQMGRPPRLLTTAPIALLKATQALAGAPVDRPIVIAHWGPAGLTVVVASDGVLKLARQISRLATPDLDPLSWITTEIQRSVRHHAQVSKGEPVEQAFIGTAEPIGKGGISAAREIEGRLGMPVGDLDEALAQILPDDVVEGADVPAGAFLFAFGAALLEPRETPNLVPPAIALTKRFLRIRNAAVAAGVVVAIGLAVGLARAGHEAGTLRASVERQRKQERAVQAELAEIGRIGDERERVRRWTHLLTDDPLKQLILSDPLKEVSRLAADDLRLERLSIARGERGYSMKLAGTIRQRDLAEAQATFNRLYFGLRESPLFFDVGFMTRGTPAPSEPPPSSPAPDASTAEPTAAQPQLTFEVTLLVKGMQ